VDLHTRFLAAVRRDTGRVRAEGTVLHRGSRTATAEASLTDVDGRLLAHATSSCLLVPAR
jgi:acyl-coenzyme A thioesterase PaaI-like protein